MHIVALGLWQLYAVIPPYTMPASRLLELKPHMADLEIALKHHQEQ